MKALVRSIHPGNFLEDVVLGKSPFLLLCTIRDKDLSKQIKILEEIAGLYPEDLKVGFWAEECLAGFKTILVIMGTPTFLLLAEGREIGRWLGAADQMTLKRFIAKSLATVSRGMRLII